MTAPALIFDGECGVCRRLASWAARRLPGTVRVIPSQAAAAHTYGLTPLETAASVYWVDSRNQRWSAEQAIARALVAMNQPWRAVGHAIALPGVSRVAAVGYRLVAANRRFLPGGTSSCELPSEPIGR